MKRRQQSYGLPSSLHGLSHELRKCPPDTSLPSLRPGRSFESFFAPKRGRQQASLAYSYEALPSVLRTAVIPSWTLPRAKEVSPGHFLAQPTAGPLFRVLFRTKKRTPVGVLFFGARDGTRTHTAKPHAPQTCLSTIPTLSQVLTHYNLFPCFCQHLFIMS